MKEVLLSITSVSFVHQAMFFCGQALSALAHCLLVAWGKWVTRGSWRRLEVEYRRHHVHLFYWLTEQRSLQLRGNTSLEASLERKNNKSF